MKRVFIIVALMFVFIAAAVAVEPSNIVVTVNGKSYFKHKVASGDTLYAIAKAYNVTEKQITDSNIGLSAETLRADSYILVPRSKNYKPANSDTESEKDKPKAKSIDTKKFIRYVVRRGDTIYSIARRYKISVSTLEDDNPEIDIDHISPGDTILVRRSERGYVSSEDIERERELREGLKSVELSEGEHRVAVGETVYFLAQKYGLAEEEFMAINGLKDPSELKVGMVVRTKSSDSTETKVGEEESTADDTAIIAEGEGIDHFGDGAHDIDVDITPVEVTFPPLSLHHTLKVALMLPFHMNGKVNPYFVDFYRGLLLAMEDLKAEGYDIELSVFDTCGDGSRINDIVSYEVGLQDAQLIIGPVYEGELRYVLGFAEENEVPLISPLADVGALQSPVLFQMQANSGLKGEKLSQLFDGSREMVTIYSSSMDYDYLGEMRALSNGATERQLNYVFDRGSYFYLRNADGSNGAEIDIVEFMRDKSSKAFVIASKNETEVDRILTTLASTKASVVGRGMTYGDYIVIGNRKWKQSRNIEKQSFFRNNTIFISPYYANRSDENIRIFDGRYVTAYDSLPTMYSYRGYDAAMIFCCKMFTGIDSSIHDESFTPLATTYRFGFDDGHYVNNNWIREHYKSDFTIVVD